jgi:transcriptional regulator with XRE-family HTH domain
LVCIINKCYKFEIIKWRMNDMSKLKDCRVLKGLSQAELARMIGTQQAQIQRWETGERKVSDKYIRALVKALDCRLADVRPDLAGI